MAKQTYYVQRPQQPNYRDVLWLSAIHANLSNTATLVDSGVKRGFPESLYNLTWERPENPDVVFYSAHDPDSMKLVGLPRTSKRVCVVSYVPSVKNEAEWPAFYTALCVSDAIACDAYTAYELTKFTLPTKLRISLEGCTITEGAIGDRDTGGLLELRVELWNADSDTLFWDVFAPIAIKRGLTLVDTPATGTIAVAFRPLGSLLSGVYSQSLRWCSTGYDPIASSMLDCRQNHNLNIHLEKLIQIPGAVAVNQLQKEFETYLEELLQCVDHSLNTVFEPFKSHTSIFDRSFHTINRLG